MTFRKHKENKVWEKGSRLYIRVGVISLEHPGSSGKVPNIANICPNMQTGYGIYL